MVQAMININEQVNRVLNIVKAQYGFKTKSEAIEFVTEQYESQTLEPELRPEFINKMGKRQLESTVKIKNFKKHFGLK